MESQKTPITADMVRQYCAHKTEVSIPELLRYYGADPGESNLRVAAAHLRVQGWDKGRDPKNRRAIWKRKK